MTPCAIWQSGFRCGLFVDVVNCSMRLRRAREVDRLKRKLGRATTLVCLVNQRHKKRACHHISRRPRSALPTSPKKHLNPSSNPIARRLLRSLRKSAPSHSLLIHCGKIKSLDKLSLAYRGFRFAHISKMMCHFFLAFFTTRLAGSFGLGVGSAAGASVRSASGTLSPRETTLLALQT